MKVLLAVAALTAIAVLGCAERVAVWNTRAPTLDASPYHTFAMMTVPPHSGADSGSPSSPGSAMDPMLLNSPVGRAIRTDIVHSFVRRGYAESAAPDFLVAYYAGAGDIINVQTYPYGYSGASNTGKMTITDYPAGTVIVDVIDAKTNQLVWRGQGVSKIPDSPHRYSRQLAVAVSDIIAQFPKAAVLLKAAALQ